jgi:hypothetical protein
MAVLTLIVYFTTNTPPAVGLQVHSELFSSLASCEAAAAHYRTTITGNPIRYFAQCDAL